MLQRISQGREYVKAPQNADDILLFNGNRVPYDKNTETFLGQIPAAQTVADAMLGSYTAAPLEGNLFNAAAGMKLVGDKELVITGVNNIKM